MNLTHWLKQRMLLPHVRVALARGDDIALSEALHLALRNKPFVKAHYEWSYQRMVSKMSPLPGTSIEIGGQGEIREFLPKGKNAAFSTNIVRSPHIQLRCDAQHLPFKSGAIANYFLRSVLHHIHDPVAFLVEAERTLMHGGRIIMHEPHISQLSRWIFPLHFESCEMNPPELKLNWDRTGVVVDSNIALPDLCFLKRWEEVALKVPALRLVEIHYQDVLAYLLSGGLHFYPVVPATVQKLIWACEKKIPNRFLSYLSCVMVVVLEKRATPRARPDRPLDAAPGESLNR